MLKNNKLICSIICSGFLIASTVSFAANADKEVASAKSDAHHHNHAKPEGSSHHDQCRQRMTMVDRNNDGKISKDEFIKHHEDMFVVMDTNKDGFLDDSEMHHMMMDHNMHGKQGNSDHGHHHDTDHAKSTPQKDKSK